MILLDVNVLIAFFRPDHPHHSKTSAWWSRELDDGQRPVTATDLAWVGFVRIVTNPRAMPVPDDPEQAIDFMNDVMAQDYYRPSIAGPRLMDLFGTECVGHRASGNLVTDVYIAAAARSIGAAVATHDRDFRRFDGLQIIEPA